MSKEEERVSYEKEKEQNLRFIRAKLPGATPRELSLIASFIRGLKVKGWSESEYNRNS